MKEFDINGLRLAEYQAKLFEKSATRFNCSSSIFLRRFLHSNLLKTLDMNESSMISLNVEEGLNEIELQFNESDYGKIKYSPDALFWIGYIYRYISYTRDIETAHIMKLFKHTQLNNLYYSYHTQDMEWCVKSLLELNNFSENIFDKNWRLKQIILKNKKDI